MASTSNAADKPEDPETRLARLRGQVDSLAEDRVTPVVTKFTADVRKTFGDTATMLRAQLESLSRQVERRPLISIVIAAGFGVIIGRAIR